MYATITLFHCHGEEVVGCDKEEIPTVFASVGDEQYPTRATSFARRQTCLTWFVRAPLHSSQFTNRGKGTLSSRGGAHLRELVFRELSLVLVTFFQDERAIDSFHEVDARPLGGLLRQRKLHSQGATRTIFRRSNGSYKNIKKKQRELYSEGATEH